MEEKTLKLVSRSRSRSADTLKENKVVNSRSPEKKKTNRFHSKHCNDEHKKRPKVIEIDLRKKPLDLPPKPHKIDTQPTNPPMRFANKRIPEPKPTLPSKNINLQQIKDTIAASGKLHGWLNDNLSPSQQLKVNLAGINNKQAIH